MLLYLNVGEMRLACLLSNGDVISGGNEGGLLELHCAFAFTHFPNISGDLIAQLFLSIWK